MSASSLRVLITNLVLWPPSGTALYVRDLALELQRQGHRPAVFSSTRGSIADGLRAAGIPVSDSLSRLDEPDIIHGHHHAPTLIALKQWPSIPAISICHSHQFPQDRSPAHPNIRRRFGVSRVCVQRLVEEGAPMDAVALLPNFVDVNRFSPRAPLPDRPRRALLFSNYATEESHLPAVREACVQTGLELEVVGAGVGKVDAEPERKLGQYDIVFAKAKAAIEAMSVGTAVVLCDYAGVGPMVTAAHFDWLRERNFGFEVLRDPLSPEPLVREIARYDAQDAARVRDLVRSRASLDGTAAVLVAIYREVLEEHRRVARPSRRTWPTESSWRGRLYLRLFWAWASVPARLREMIRKLPGWRMLVGGLRRLG